MSWVGVIISVLAVWLFGRPIFALIIGTFIALGYFIVKAFKATKAGIRGLFSQIETKE